MKISLSFLALALVLFTPTGSSAVDRQSTAAPQGSMAVITNLRCEFLATPLGIDDVHPALSWTISDPRRGVVQTAYRVLVASTEEQLARDAADLWDSGTVVSDQSHLVSYRGKPLASRQRCYWKVQIETRADHEATSARTWSPVSWWEMGLLRPSDWQGSWIQSAACAPIDDDVTRLWMRQAAVPQALNRRAIQHDPALARAAEKESARLMGSILPLPVFRRAFELDAPVRRARLYISGLGYSEAFVNGQPISDRMFDPSVSLYRARGLYVTHDITPWLHPGRNFIAATVGSGLWHDSIVWGSPDNFLGAPSLRAQLEVELTDGRRVVVPTDASWTTAVGPALKSHYWAGEAYDARRGSGWQDQDDEGLSWTAATEVKAPVPALEAQRCEPERIIARIKPVALSQPMPGIWVFDLGRMVVGTVELHVKAPRGTPVLLRTAEWTWQPERQGPQFAGMLSHLHYDATESTTWTPGMIVGKPRGSSYYSWSYELPRTGGPKQVHLGVPTLVYVASGAPQGETWHPRFSISPFRYVEVQGLRETPTLDLLTGLDISNDEEVVGKFTSDNPRFNAIFEAAMNSTRFNTHGMTWDNGVERLQSQVYHAWSAPFASYILWYPNLWRKVMEDQRRGDVLAAGKRQVFGSTIYGMRGLAFTPARNPVTQGVTVELPLAYYDRYGDRRELERQYPDMKAWCEAFFPAHDGHLLAGASMAAWNDHFYREMSADSAWTPRWDQGAMISMILYQRVREVAGVARLLGKPADAESLDQLAARIRAVINETWYNPTQKTYGAAIAKAGGQIDASTGWHGLMAMAIATGIAPDSDVPQILENCVADMKKHYRGHEATGHITHQVLYDVLSEHHLLDTCYELMNATAFPSFTWMLQSGNRTIPEGPTWTDKLPSAASACQNECQEPARWFTQTLCGVMPDRAEPGFKHVLLQPHIPTRLGEASLVTRTPYGELESSWTQKNGTVTWVVRIPANTYATASIPAVNAGAVRESGTSLAEARGCRIISAAPGQGVICRLGSGRYTFQFPASTNAAAPAIARQ